MLNRPALSAALAAALLAVPVALETQLDAAWTDQRPGHLFFATTQLAGWTILVLLVRGIRRLAPGRRWPGAVVLAGCGLQLLFAAAYAVSAALAGEPNESVFVLFLFGFLALTVGGAAWGLALRKLPSWRTPGTGFLALSACGFLAIAIGTDPLHDLFLLAGYASWVLVGRGPGQTAAAGPRPVGAASGG